MNHLYLVGEFRREMERCGLWDRVKITLEAGAVSLSALILVGLVLVVKVPESVSLALVFLVIAVPFGLLFVHLARLNYEQWRDVCQEIEDSDEPPTRPYEEHDRYAA